MYKVVESKSTKRKYLVIIKSLKKEEEFLISEDLMVEFRLVKGKELEKEQFFAFKEAYKRDELYQKVLHYALYKQRCTYEIKTYLEKKNIPLESYDYYINKLKKTRILDDVNYAQNFIHEAFSYKLLGPDKIKYELSKKHIHQDMYQQFFDDISFKDIENNVITLLQKKLKSIKKGSYKKAVIDIKQFIVNKGYHFDVVNSVVDAYRDEIRKAVPENESLEKDFQLALRKYQKDKTKEYQNILAYLLRKGYSYNKIKERMGEYYE